MDVYWRLYRNVCLCGLHYQPACCLPVNMLDLKRFSQDVQAIAPIVGGIGRCSGRRFSFTGIEDGWYSLSLGNKVTIERKATALEALRAREPLPKLHVLALGTEGIPLHFDGFARQGLGEAVSVNFLNLPTFAVAQIVCWEDKRFYFDAQEIPRDYSIIQAAKQAFEKDGDLYSIKGVTPELRYYFVLCNLQRQSYRAAVELERFKLDEAERAKRIAEFQQTFAGRLRDTITRAGGSLVRYSKQGNGYLVHWKIGGQLVKSTISDNMSILSLGYCASGADKDHTMASAVQLAKMFQEDRPLYITRE